MSSSHPKALLVLGDAGFAASIANYIAVRGFEPILAKTGASAFDVWKEQKPDVIVAAQLLPGMDGPTLCKVVKESDAKTPVILVSPVTSSAGLNDVRRTSGADEVLPASFKPEALILLLRRLTSPSPPAGSTPSKGFKAASKPPAAAPEPPSDQAAKGAPSSIASTPSLEDIPEIDLTDSLIVLSQQIEEAMRTSPETTAPPRPVAPSPDGIAAAPAAPQMPIDPAWIIGRALVDGITGAVRFVSGGVERVVYFAQGRPIVVTSNVPEERIGQILIRKGLITAKELDQALSISKKKDKRLAQIVVEMGVMTQRDHDEELAGQYSERLVALFAWTSAAVEFKPHPAPDELVQIRLAPERIVMDGLRHHYDVPRLEAALQNPQRVLYAAPNLGERLPYLNLSQLESAVLLLLDGRRTIAEAAGMAPSRADALRTLYAGACLNLLV